MEIFEVLESDIDGGSIQCFVNRKGLRNISQNVNKILEKEELSKIYSLEKQSSQKTRLLKAKLALNISFLHLKQL